MNQNHILSQQVSKQNLEQPLLADPRLSHNTHSFSQLPLQISNNERGRHLQTLNKRQLSQKKSESRKFSPGSSEVRSNKSGRSNGSRRSGMTRNPLHFEEKVLMHKVPGIDDRESHIYREFDSKGRCSQTFYQRAAL